MVRLAATEAEKPPGSRSLQPLYPNPEPKLTYSGSLLLFRCFSFTPTSCPHCQWRLATHHKCWVSLLSHPCHLDELQAVTDIRVCGFKCNPAPFFWAFLFPVNLFLVSLMSITSKKLCLFSTMDRDLLAAPTNEFLPSTALCVRRGW